MKKVFNIILTILLLSFSFYYTNFVLDYLKNKDPLMLKIKENEKKFYQAPVDAIIDEQTIIPGKRGRQVNLTKSYLNMKKVNTYLESLLVFDYLSPKVSLKDNLTKSIRQGNPLNNNISIVVKINDLKLLQEISQVKEINFILTASFIENNKAYLKNIENNILSYDEIDPVSYCYQATLKTPTCKTLPTINPTLITHDYFVNTYQSLKNGQILEYQIHNKKSIKDLEFLITTIKNLSYNLVSLDTLLKE